MSAELNLVRESDSRSRELGASRFRFRFRFRSLALMALLALPSVSEADGIQVSLSGLTVDRHGERGSVFHPAGDEPYLITVGVRSRWLTPGSTTAEWSRYAGLVGEDLTMGARRPIDSRMGLVEFGRVEPVSLAEAAAGARPELFMVLVVAMENDSWTAARRRDFGDRLAAALARHVAPLIEDGRLDIFDPGSSVADVEAAIERDLAPVTMFELVAALLSCITDPDELIGSHAIIIPGLTDRMNRRTTDMTLVSGFGSTDIDDGDPIRFAKSGTRWHVTGNVTVADTAACDRLVQQAREGGPTIPLFAWYSHGRGDNVAITHPSWRGCMGEVRSPDYRSPRILGLVFSPERPAPANTIPLYRWYSDGRGDNWTTTRHGDLGAREEGLDPDYGFSQLEGYILRGAGF